MSVPRRAIAASALALALVPAVAAAQPRTVRYDPGPTEVKYVYGVAEPVATLRPGDILETRTLDASATSSRSRATRWPWSRATTRSPARSAIEGRGAGRHAGRQDPRAHRRQRPGRRRAGARLRRAQHDELHADAAPAAARESLVLPHRPRRRTRRRSRRSTPNFSVKIPLQPFLGCIGVAPAGGEARSSVDSRPSTAATWTRRRPAPATPLYFPVNAPGRAALPRRRPRRAGRRRDGRHRPSRCRCACGCRST